MITLKNKTKNHHFCIGDFIELKNGARAFITEYGIDEFNNALYGIGILKINTDIVGYKEEDLYEVGSQYFERLARAALIQVDM
jgi:hypothetical protein